VSRKAAPPKRAPLKRGPRPQARVGVHRAPADRHAGLGGHHAGCDRRSDHFRRDVALQGPGPAAKSGDITSVVLRKGASLPEIASTLERGGVIRSSSIFMTAAKVTGAARSLKAGEYEIKNRASMAADPRRHPPRPHRPPHGHRPRGRDLGHGRRHPDEVAGADRQRPDPAGRRRAARDLSGRARPGPRRRAATDDGRPRRTARRAVGQAPEGPAVLRPRKRPSPWPRSSRRKRAWRRSVRAWPPCSSTACAPACAWAATRPSSTA
jgi:hypothetical protein